MYHPHILSFKYNLFFLLLLLPSRMILFMPKQHSSIYVSAGVIMMFLSFSLSEIFNSIYDDIFAEYRMLSILIFLNLAIAFVLWFPYFYEQCYCVSHNHNVSLFIAAMKIYFIFLVFACFTMMYRDVGFFVFILLGVNRIYCTCGLVLVFGFRKFLAYIS